MTSVISRIAFGIGALSAATTAFAATPVQLRSDVFVERQITRADGSKATTLEKPNMVLPGDNLVFVVNYKNVGSASADNFTVTNPLPKAVAFNGTADGREIVSVDGGKNWGVLSTLMVPTLDGKLRAARSSDVTHIKWNFQKKLDAGAEGKLIFRGIVR